MPRYLNAPTYGGPRPGFDFLKRMAEFCLGHFGIVSRLRTQPVPVRQTEEAAESKIRIGRHRALSGHDLADPLRRHTNLLRQSVLRQAERHEKFFPQQFSGCDWLKGLYGVLPANNTDTCSYT